MSNAVPSPQEVAAQEVLDAAALNTVDDGGIGAPAAVNAPAAMGPAITSHRTARAAATWAATACYSIVTISVAFVTTPLLLRYLGQERLGAYRAAAEWIGYLSLIDLGITPALSVLLLRVRAKRSTAETATVFRSGLLLLFCIALITAGLACCLSIYMPQLVKVSSGLKHELVISTLVSAVLVLFLPFQMSRMLLEVEQRGYLINIAHLCQAVCAAILSVVLARAGFGLVAQSAALVGGMSLGTVFYLMPTWRWYITPPSGERIVTPSSVWKLSWPLALSGLGMRLNLMTDSLVVGFILGPTAVFYFFVTQRLIILFAGQVNSIGNASWAALAEMRLMGKRDEYAAGLSEVTGLVVGLGTALTGTVVAFNNDFVRLWVGASHYGGNLLSYLTALSTLVVGVTGLFGFSLDSAGETASRIPVSLSGAMLNLVLSVTLTKLMGLPGVVLGTIIAMLLSDTWFCPYLVSRRFGVSKRALALATAGGIARGAPCAVAAALIAHVYHPTSWVTFAGEAILIGGVSLGYSWLVVLTPKDRIRWSTRLRSTLTAIR